MVKLVQDIGEDQPVPDAGVVARDGKGVRLPDRIRLHCHGDRAAHSRQHAGVAGRFVPAQQNSQQRGLRPQLAVFAGEIEAQVRGVDAQVAAGVLGGQQAFDAGAGLRKVMGMVQQHGGARHAVEPVGLGLAVPPQELDFPATLFGQDAQILGAGSFGKPVRAIDVVVLDQVGHELVQAPDEAQFQVTRQLGGQPAGRLDVSQAQKAKSLGSCAVWLSGARHGNAHS